MLSISRICGASAIRLPHIFGFTSKNVGQKMPLRSYVSLVCRRQQLFGQSALKIFQKGSTTTSLRLASDSSQKSKKAIGYWLLTCSGMVFVAVALGGVTRLNESSLSMVKWKVLNSKMPGSQQDWEEEFSKFQQDPEFKHKNKEITLSEFKTIWYMEFAHRQWTGLLGAVFLIPATYFWAKGRLAPGVKKRVTTIGVLMGAQVLTGWYMVKSSSAARAQNLNDTPSSPQYRLAGHTGLAYFLYAFLLWSTLFHLLPAEQIQIGSAAALKASKKFRTLCHVNKGLIFLTAVSGAFVGGLNAGLVYNSFPKMADKWIPDDIMAYTPKFVNFTENPTTVQFEHRILGTTTLGFITAVWWFSRKRILPRRAYIAATTLAIVAYSQVALGITSLLSYVPTSTAAMHQSGSLLLMSTALWLSHELRRLPK